MKLIDTAPLQEPNDSQFRLDLGSYTKRILKAMGWVKGDRIAVHRHGAGIMLLKAAGNIDEELAAIKKEEAKPEETPEKKKGKK